MTVYLQASFPLNSIDIDSVVVLNLSGDHSTDLPTATGSGDRESYRHFIHPPGEIHLRAIVVAQHQSYSSTV